MRSPTRWMIGVAGLGLLVASIAWLARPNRESRRIKEPMCGNTRCRHVHDEAGILPPADIPRFEDYMGQILRESDVDLRFVFVNGTSGKPIEELAAAKVQELSIGGRDREKRGTLLLYDVPSKRLRVEVGYGLEPYFPDAFVDYLIRDHVQMFFASGDLSLGLRLLLRMMQNRIREAVLGGPVLVPELQ